MKGEKKILLCRFKARKVREVMGSGFLAAEMEKPGRKYDQKFGFGKFISTREEILSDGWTNVIFRINLKTRKLSYTKGD